MKTPRRWRLAALAAGLSWLAACGGNEAESVEPGPDSRGEDTVAHGPPLEGPAEAEGFVARITPLAGPIPMNEPFGVELALFELDGETPWEPDEVQLDARMPEHEHGMLRYVELERVGPARWRAQGLLFHMVGLWQFHVDARVGARIERAALEIVL